MANLSSSASELPSLSQSSLRKGLMSPRGQISKLMVLPEVESTNTTLVKYVLDEPDEWRDLSLIATDHQSQGRGRAGRGWIAPPRSSVLFSIALRPVDVPVDRWNWLPMLASVAVRRALFQRAGIEAKLKWPNDVLIPSGDNGSIEGWGTYRKVGGTLAELIDDGSNRGEASKVVVLGMGLNVTQTREELPVEWATSLQLAGARTADRETILKAIIRALVAEYETWIDAEGDAEECGLADAVRRNCMNIGQEVRITLPSDEILIGQVETIDSDGRLVVCTPDGSTRGVIAGDVLNVRT